MRAIHLLQLIVLLIVPRAIAANQPKFTYTLPNGGTTTRITAVAVDTVGNTYLTGSTTGPFPATPGALQTQFAGGICQMFFAIYGVVENFCTDAFVIKLDTTGTVMFATYLGGEGSQTAGTAIALDAQGNIYVAGTTVPNTNTGEPDTFPVTPGAAFARPANANAFVAKLNAAGSQLIYATSLPLAFPAVPFTTFPLVTMAIDPIGNAYIAGNTDPSTNPIPTTPGAFQATSGNAEVASVVLKLNASGSALVYATYFPGSLAGIAVDAAGDAFVTGTTTSQNFPVTPGALQTQFPSPAAGFVSKLNPQGTGLVYSTFLQPGSEGAIKVDPQGGVWVLGNGNGSGFLAHLSADGSTLLYANYLPATGLDVDSAGNAYVAGTVNCACLPAVPGAFQPDYGVAPVTITNYYGSYVSQPPEVFAMKFTPDGQVAGATYVGGALDVAALNVAPNGSVVITGGTFSPDFPGISGPTPTDGSAVGFVSSIFPAITIENSASYVANTAVPGEMISIQGYGIGPAAGLVSSPVTELGGVQVFFDNFAAPITYVQAAQINVQAPWEISGQTTTRVRIVYNGVEAGSAIVPVGAAVPGVFYIDNSDGSRNSPSNPARPGDFVSVYGTGGGAMSPLGVTGNSWPLAPLSFLGQPVSAKVGAEAAAVLYSGSAPTLDSGFFQINVRLPADLTAAARFLLVTIGSVTSAPTAMSIQ